MPLLCVNKIWPERDRKNVNGTVPRDCLPFFIWTLLYCTYIYMLIKHFPIWFHLEVIFVLKVPKFAFKKGPKSRDYVPCHNFVDCLQKRNRRSKVNVLRYKKTKCVYNTLKFKKPYDRAYFFWKKKRAINGTSNNGS